MVDAKNEKQELVEQRDALNNRLDAIQKDYQQGLDADSEERAIQLENAEVLDGIYKATMEELQLVEKRLSELG